MSVDNQSVVELTKAVELLGNNINRMAITMLVCMFVSIIFVWFIIKHYEKISNHSLGGFNPDKATKLYEADKLSELLKYCLKFHSKYPNDVQISFYLGLAYYKLGNFAEAKRYFRAAEELNPHYKESVSPYLEEISKQVSSAKNSAIS